MRYKMAPRKKLLPKTIPLPFPTPRATTDYQTNYYNLSIPSQHRPQNPSWP